MRISIVLGLMLGLLPALAGERQMYLLLELPDQAVWTYKLPRPLANPDAAISKQGALLAALPPPAALHRDRYPSCWMGRCSARP